MAATGSVAGDVMVQELGRKILSIDLIRRVHPKTKQGEGECNLVRVETMSGEWGVYDVDSIRRFKDEAIAKKNLSKRLLSTCYPIYVDNLLLFAEKPSAKIRHIDVFKAICRSKPINIR